MCVGDGGVFRGDSCAEVQGRCAKGGEAENKVRNIPDVSCGWDNKLIMIAS